MQVGKLGKKSMKNSVKINEVDCYIENALRTKYATHNAVQHQILVNGNPLGFLNMPADSDRSSRVVKEVEVSSKYVELFEKCLELMGQRVWMRNSMEDFKKEEKHNKPIDAKILKIAKEMYAIESLGLDFKTYFKILKY